MKRTKIFNYINLEFANSAGFGWGVPPPLATSLVITLGETNLLTRDNKQDNMGPVTVATFNETLPTGEQAQGGRHNINKTLTTHEVRRFATGEGQRKRSLIIK